MNSGGGDVPPSLPVNGGEFLLQLLRKPPNSRPQTPSQPLHSPAFSVDPAVAAVGAEVYDFPLGQPLLPSNAGDMVSRNWSNNPPTLAPHYFFPQNPRANPSINPSLSSAPQIFNQISNQGVEYFNRMSPGDDAEKLRYVRDQQEQNLIFGSVNRDVLRHVSSLRENALLDRAGQMSNFGNSYVNKGLGVDKRASDLLGNSVEVDRMTIGNSRASSGLEQERKRYGNNMGKQNLHGKYRELAQHPPGFSSEIKNVGKSEYGNKKSFSNSSKGRFDKNNVLSNQLNSPGLPAGSSLHSVSVSDIEESMRELHVKDADNVDELNDLEDHLLSSVSLADGSDDKIGKKSHIRDKDYRSDKRGQWITGQRIRNLKRQAACRSDINRLNMPFLAVYDSLIPSDEEKAKQTQLLITLENLVKEEWPEARLYLYGSCANSFSFSRSDLDVCLAMEDENIDKCEVLLKLADILQSTNFQNVQALTRARVPIVKLMDQNTQISCDICVNNVLAVVNTKLLRDYAQIDVRLRQLAFIVKHWAKSRGVNETYQGTLSSYAYVLMCIHFLQQRRPAILPCLQGMHATYSATVNNIECAYYDDIDKVSNFGSRNGESIARLVWAFFVYWAYCHDYTSDVISIRTGITLSKSAKDWTRRVGNDRHLICIEDPFEVSHDLGRVVDKFSIRVLREEFERAAEIMQHDPNPCVTLFEPYVPT